MSSTTFIAATDDADDPTHWILDQIIAQMPNGTLKSLADGRRAVRRRLPQRPLLQIAPDFVTTIVQVGNDFGDMAKHFGLNETLDVAKAASGVHRDGHRGSACTSRSTTSRPTSRSPTTDRERRGEQRRRDARRDRQARRSREHKMPLSYGKVLRSVSTPLIIPALDPNATNLQELLADHVNCAGRRPVRSTTRSSIQFGFGGGAGTWASGLHRGPQLRRADASTRKIADIDSVGSRVRPRRARRRRSTRTTTTRSTRSRPASGPAR